MMRCQRLSRLHLLLIAPLTLLVFSARLTWTQERPLASRTPTQLSKSYCARQFQREAAGANSSVARGLGDVIQAIFRRPESELGNAGSDSRYHEV